MKINLISPCEGERVPLLTLLHKDFLRNDGNKDPSIEACDYFNLYRQGIDNSFGEPVKFKWNCYEKACLHLSLSKDFFEYSVYETDEDHAEIYNLLLGKTYYWRVCTLSGNLSEVRSFETEDMPPRWIKASQTMRKDQNGITNIRDFGGWKTKQGKKIKQGLIFRGSEMDDHCVLSEYGRNILLNDLKIKTDYDLRKCGDLLSPLGNGVKLIRIPLLGAYGRISEFKDDFRDMFRVFVDEKNYPMYVHCWGGADRTGTLLFLLGALLGMSEKDLFLEYELTTFSVWGPRSSESELFTAFKKALSEYGAKTDSIVTQSRNFVLSTGITEEQIEKIKSILLE